MWGTWIGMGLAIALWDWIALALSRRRLGYLTKPAVIVALLLAVLSGNATLPQPSPMLSWVAAGLFFSLLGDIFLMLPHERFQWGLIAFVVAHVAYLLAFSLHTPPFTLWTGVIAIAVGLTAGRFYQRLVAALREQEQMQLVRPVAIYTVAISLMLVSALLLPFRTDLPRGGTLTIAVGATLFFLSDALLAWNRFVHPVAQGRLVVRVLYHLGQTAIVLGALLTAGATLPQASSLSYMCYNFVTISLTIIL